MDYKNEMRKLIDIIKQQSFEATLEDTVLDVGKFLDLGIGGGATE